MCKNSSNLLCEWHAYLTTVQPVLTAFPSLFSFEGTYTPTFTILGVQGIFWGYTCTLEDFCKGYNNIGVCKMGHVLWPQPYHSLYYCLIKHCLKHCVCLSDGHFPQCAINNMCYYLKIDNFLHSQSEICTRYSR